MKIQKDKKGGYYILPESKRERMYMGVVLWRLKWLFNDVEVEQMKEKIDDLFDI